MRKMKCKLQFPQLKVVSGHQLFDEESSKVIKLKDITMPNFKNDKNLQFQD